MARLGMLMDHPQIVRIIGVLMEEDAKVTVLIENFDIGCVLCVFVCACMCNCTTGHSRGICT
jgi:hypothetical protein